MDNISQLVSICELLRTELQQELSYYTNRVHTPTGKFKSIVGSKYDSAVYRLLLESVSTSSSVMQTAPRLSCLLMSIQLCLKVATSKDIQAQIMATHNVPALTSDNLAELKNLAESLVGYTEEQIFEPQAVETEELKMLRRKRLLLQRSIPIFKCMQDIVTTNLQNAIEDSNRLKREVSATHEETLNLSGPEIDELNIAISNLDSAIAGNSQIALMERLTYPMATAECICGNCGAAKKATDVLKIRPVNATTLKYNSAIQTINVNMSGSTIYNSDDQEVTKILKNAGMFFPLICDKCGCLNIPSLHFLYLFKISTIMSWLRNPPNEKNFDTVITCSSNVVPSYLRAYASADEQTIQQLISKLKPEAVNKAEEIVLPKLDTSALFSSETYSNYFSQLDLQQSVQLLTKPHAKNIRLLQYILQSLCLATVGYTPIDAVTSVLAYTDFADFREELDILAKEILETRSNYLRLKHVLKVITSEYWLEPLTNIQDIVVNEECILPILEKSSLWEAVPTSYYLNETKLDTDLVASSVNDLGEHLERIYRRIDEIGIHLQESLLKYENTLLSCNANTLQELTYDGLGAVDDTQTLLTIKHANLNNDVLSTSGVCSILWKYIEDAFEPLLVQTVYANRQHLVANKYIFGTILRTAESGRQSYANKRIKALTDEVSVNSAIAKDLPRLFMTLLKVCMLPYVSAKQLGQFMGISEVQLLGVGEYDLPTTEQYDNIIFYNILESVGFPVSLSLYASGATVNDYESTFLKTADDVKTIMEATAYAEAAAVYYIQFSDVDTNKDALKEQLSIT